MADGTTRPGRRRGASREAELPRLANYVGGEWREVDGVEGASPTSTRSAARIGGDGAAVGRRGGRTRRSRPPGPRNPAWRAAPPQQRARAVLALRGGAPATPARSWPTLVSADMGKTLADADAEVGRGIESVESAAAIPHLLKGENLEGVAGGVDVEMVRQPVGVVAAITPFNFPAMIPLWFLPYAIACGNTFVLKPSEQDPRPSVLIVEMVDAVEEIPRRRRQPRPRRPRRGQRDPRAARDRRVSFVGRRRDGADHRPGRGGDRQAGAGARRGQELAGRDARRRPRAGGAGDHGLRLRRRRPALPGRLGLRPRSATRRAHGRGARGAGRRRRRRSSSATAPTPAPTSARWSRPRPASGSPTAIERAEA